MGLKKYKEKIINDMIGKTFNRLTVISYNQERRGYNCICTCGNETVARGDALKKDKHKSCGCLTRENVAKKHTKPNHQALKNGVFRNYKSAANRRGYDFELTLDEFEKIISDDCHYCGQEPNMVYTGHSRKTTDITEFKFNGVDRVDNTKGYTIENSVACCKICNNAKSTLTVEEFLDWILRIYNFKFK